MKVKQIIGESKDCVAVIFNSTTRATDESGDQVQVPMAVQVLTKQHYDYIIQTAKFEKEANGLVPPYLRLETQKGKVYDLLVETDSREQAVVQMHESDLILVDALRELKANEKAESAKLAELEAEKAKDKADAEKAESAKLEAEKDKDEAVKPKK